MSSDRNKPTENLRHTTKSISLPIVGRTRRRRLRSIEHCTPIFSIVQNERHSLHTPTIVYLSLYSQSHRHQPCRKFNDSSKIKPFDEMQCGSYWWRKARPIDTCLCFWENPMGTNFLLTKTNSNSLLVCQHISHPSIYTPFQWQKVFPDGKAALSSATGWGGRGWRR